jgi:carboxymethylenebutenolidase
MTMAELVSITAADGHVLDAFVARPAGDIRGGLVVVQEIFGINGHIQDICKRFAKQGYVAIAPALFDRQEKGVDLGYDADGLKKGVELKNGADDDAALLDIAAARDAIADAGHISVIGYCWGGKLAYLTACRLEGFFKAIGYYGGGIITYNALKPQIPTMLHFGDQDAGIPLTDVDAIMNAHPELEVYIYQAQHGFNCDQRGSYNATAARLALERSLAFLAGR